MLPLFELILMLFFYISGLLKTTFAMTVVHLKISVFRLQSLQCHNCVYI